MCIVCNTDDSAAADRFLEEFRLAIRQMHKAENAMLEVVKHGKSQTIKSRYKSAHKAMVLARKAFAKVEHHREMERLIRQPIDSVVK